MNARANNNGGLDSRILGGGSLEAPGAAVTPGVLSGLGVSVPGAKAVIPRSRIRLTAGVWHWRGGLWIGNPLTARSIVNRVGSNTLANRWPPTRTTWCWAAS